MSDITLLVPTYNPGKGWDTLFKDRYLEFCSAVGETVKVVLINDGSKNEVGEEVKNLQKGLGPEFTYLSYDVNQGKGAALKYGVMHTVSQKYIFTDIDFPYTTSSMLEVWKAAKKTTGIITGYRQEAYYADLSVFRTILSKSLRWLNQAMLGLPVNDTQCGLKAFDSEVKTLLLQCETDRFLIDLELLLAVSHKKYTITPVQVALRDDIDFTSFNSSVLLKEVFNFFRLIWKYRVFPS